MSFSWLHSPLYLFTLSALSLGVWTDLRSRRVPNKLILAGFVIACALNLYFREWSGLAVGLIGVLVAFFICLPLLLTKVLGAGDVKLLMLLGFLSDGSTVVGTFLFALLWGGCLGLTKALLSGNLLQLIRNTGQLVRTRASDQSPNLHRIPYTVALLLGYLTHISLAHAGITLW